MSNGAAKIGTTIGTTNGASNGAARQNAGQAGAAGNFGRIAVFSAAIFLERDTRHNVRK
jgi:hypothetical protein